MISNHEQLFKSLDKNKEISKRAREIITDYSGDLWGNEKYIAAGMGISTASLSQLCSPHGRVSAYTMCKFCDYYGVSMDYLCGRTNNPRTNK